MKMRIFLFCLISLSVSNVFAANKQIDHTKAESFINNAKKLIDSIKNYKGHEKSLYNITNNRPAGKPGIITAYQTQKQKTLTSRINDAKLKAKEELMQAKKYADTQQASAIYNLEKIAESIN